MKVIWSSKDNSRAIEDHDGELFFVWREPIELALREVALPPSFKLTVRQKKVYGLLLDGKTNKEIATDLEIAERTVKHHVSEILYRAGVKSRGQLKGQYNEMQREASRGKHE